MRRRSTNPGGTITFAKAAVYCKYMLPALFALIMIVMASVPSFFYVYNDGENVDVREAQSLFGLYKNTFSLFFGYIAGKGNGSTAHAQKIFITDTFVYVAVSVVIWIVSVGTAVFSAVTSFLAFREEIGSEKENRYKKLFKVVFWRPAFLLLSYFPIIFTGFFPRIVANLIYNTLDEDVTLINRPNAPIYTFILFAALSAVIFFVGTRFESRERMNMFIQYKPAESGNDESRG